MWKKYLKPTLKNIFRFKAQSIINILGLALGIASFIFIVLWVKDENSFDKFHKNADNLYRMCLIDSENPEYRGGGSSYILPVILEDEYPEVISYTRWFYYSDIRPCIVSYENKIFREPFLALADSSFFTMFSFEFIKGDPRHALKDVNSIVITEEIAKKYFEDEEALGKMLKLNDKREYVVSAVVKNLSKNSTIQFDFVVSTKMFDGVYNDWAIWGTAYIELAENVLYEEFNEKIKNINMERNTDDPETKNLVALQPLSDIHFNTFLGSKRKKTVYFVSLIAAFILIIACINFINLSTARSTLRAKEIGIKKVIGIKRLQLIKQFLIEAIVLSLFALIVGMFIVESLMPSFQNLTGKLLTINYFNNFVTLPGLIALSALIGLLSGIYPAFVLTSFTPVKVLKGIRESRARKFSLRNVLVIVQFSISIFLIIATAFIFKQINYIQNKNVGYDRKNVISIPITEKYRRNYDFIKNEFKKLSNVINITTCNTRPSDGAGINPFYWEGNTFDDNVTMNYISVDYDYIETMDMEMLMGRSFSRDFSDSTNYIINEAALKLTKLEEPIGKMFSIWRREGELIGVVKDFNFGSLHDAIQPLVLVFSSNWHFSPYFLIRIEPHNLKQTITNIESTLHNIDSQYPFEYEFIENVFEANYKPEQRLGNLLMYASILTIFISCLGLFSLAAFTAEQRTKEIGVRKVFGASVNQIIFLLIKSFSRWIILSLIIAIPLAHIFVKNWLQGFAYRIDITVDVFILAGLLTVLIVIITVSYESIKAARKKPAITLKYE